MNLKNKDCMKFYVLLFFTGLFIGSCSPSPSSNDDLWSERQADDWFASEDWQALTGHIPDPSINKKKFAEHYHQNKERWDQAFLFIKEMDFNALPVGEIEIDGRDVFAKITAYDSKDPNVFFHELHREYSDIHFVVSGQEYIGEGNSETAILKTEYNEEKDIEFFDVKEGSDLLAKPGTFFLFFPYELHKQGIRVNNSEPVKKVVIKVRNHDF